MEYLIIDNKKFIEMDKKFEVGNFIVVIMPKTGYEVWFKIIGRTKKRLEVVDLFNCEDIDNIEGTYFNENSGYVNVISFTDKTNGDNVEGVSAYTLTCRYKDHCEKGTYTIALPGNIPNCPKAYNISISL